MKRKLLAILAHPDDESLGCGGTLAKYAAEGVDTFLITATRGERGRFGDQGKGVEPAVVGHVREQEVRSAAQVLGLRGVTVLDYPDGGLDQVPAEVAIPRLVSHIRQIAPDVVISFGPDGAYGHPDHIAISQFATAATICAADADYRVPDDSAPAHRVAKFYYLAWSQPKWDAYQAAFRKLTSTVNGIERQATPWPEWAITTRLDTARCWPTVWNAVSCHQSQLTIYEQLARLTPEHHADLWGSQEFYRVFSSVNSGGAVERDLFEGLR